MKTITKLLMAAILATGLFAAAEHKAQAEPAGYVYFGSFPEAATANHQVQLLNDGNDARYDAGWSTGSPDAVSRQYVVYARPRQAQPPQKKAAILDQAGQLTKAHPEDRFRLGCHAVVVPMTLTAGQTYQINLGSPRGPNFFDTWLRVQDLAGNALADDDDSGEGLDSRIVFTPTRTGVYHLVVTSYARGATGNFKLTVR